MNKSAREKYNEASANTIIKALKKRAMDGIYCENLEILHQEVKKLLPEGGTVTWGGATSLYEAGLIELIKSANVNAIDRSEATTREEAEKCHRDAFFADVYFMSANAITMEGEIVNVDGNGNRVAAMIFGPKKVVMVVGMNKVCADLDSAVKRARNEAAPINTQRLKKDTPCVITGKCHDCLMDDCVCCHTVITRKSRVNGRIVVLLVNEHLGY